MVRKSAWFCAASMAAALVFATPSHAAPRADVRLALVVGIGNTYEGAARLPTPASDASLIADVLEHDDGFAVTRLIDDKSGPLAKADLLGALGELLDKADAAQKAGKEVSLLFYFAGHGAQMDGESYLLPSKAPTLFAPGANLLQRKGEALSAQDVLNELDKIQPRRVFMILDACRNSPIAGQRAILSGLTLMRTDSPMVDNAVLFAAAPGQAALDRQAGQEHSPFTLALARALQTPGLPFYDAFAQVSQEVQKAAAPNPQKPYYDGPSFEFVFKPGERPDFAAMREQGRREALAEVGRSNDRPSEPAIWALAVQLNTADGYRFYTGLFKTGPNLAEANKRIAALTTVAAPPLDAEAAIAKAKQALASISAHDWAVLGSQSIAIRVFAQVTSDELQLLAERGDPRAQQLIGVDREIGSAGRKADYAEAMRWYRKAADQGYARAQANIGHLYLDGLGVPRDYAEAMRWYRKAADQGYALAQTTIGSLYEDGLGVAQDYAEAMRWYRKAVDQGESWAQTDIAVLYYFGRGVVQDYAEALRWSRKAADQGDTRAQVNVGIHYAYGHGVAQDYAEALRWYRKAAEQDDSQAQFNIGVFYERGRGVAQDYAEAMRWYRKAADQGDPDAQYNVGSLYNEGSGVAQDYAEAMRWYRKAADQGDPQAQTNVGFLFERGQGVPQDYAEALRWYRKAAEQGHNRAQVNL